MYEDNRVPGDILKWLSLFVIEARKQDSNRYPLKTIKLLLAGLKLHMKELHPSSPSFLNKEDDHFKNLCGTGDNVAHLFCEQGIRASVKHVKIISHKEEALLWDQGILGTRSLFYAIFFMNGEVVCLRSGRERKTFKINLDSKMIESLSSTLKKALKTVLAATKTNLGTKL